MLRADTTCLESFLVEPGRAFDLPVTFDVCGCCETVHCAVEGGLPDGDRILRLTTAVCPDHTCDCSTCVQPQGTCRLPPLAAGIYEVHVNGAPAFQLPVFEDSGVVAPPPACASYAEADPCTMGAPIATTAWIPDGVCVEQNPRAADQTIVRVTSECWGCGDLQGPCLLALEPRFTDDLPPGGELHLAATRHPTACDVDCPDICIRAERECIAPPLVRGDFYRVHVGGSPVLSFTAGDAATVCTDAAPGDP